MTRIVSRLVLTFVLVPVCVFIAIFAGLVFDNGFRWDDALSVPAAAAVGVVLYSVGFLLTWRRTVCWTPQRTRLVVMAHVAAAAACVTGFLVIYSALPRGGRTGYFLFAIVLTGGGLIGWLTQILQESPRERLARLGTPGARLRTCPLCKYDLSGLSNLHCPECGQVYTVGRFLDEHERASVPRGLEG